MDNGWIKLHRKLLENPIAKKPSYLALWIILLLKANHKEQKLMWNGEVLIVKEGQFITGRKQLSQESGIPETTIERILEQLTKLDKIGQQKTTKFRLITVINWKEYQQVDNKRTTNGQQTDTNKNEKNDKKLIPYGIKRDSRNPEIQQLFEIFKKHFGEEPIPIKGKNGQDLNRYAAKRLITKHGLDGASKLVAFILQAQDKDRFCRKSVNPLDVEKNFSWYQSYFKTKKNKSINLDV